MEEPYASATEAAPGIVRPAAAGDAHAIHALIEAAAHAGYVLPRTRDEVDSNIGLFLVWTESGEVAGCGALHQDTPELAEIRSLVVHQSLRGRGAGRAIVEACIAAAADRGISQVYALTRSDGFFERLGFSRISMAELPHKVFKDCTRCPLYPKCDEVAMIRGTEART